MEMTREEAHDLLVLRAGCKIDLKRLYEQTNYKVFVGLAEITKDIHVQDEFFWKLVELLKPSIIHFEHGTGHREEYTKAEFEYELYGEPWMIFALLKAEKEN